MNCACTVEVNCALPKDYRMTKEQDQSRCATQPGTDEVLFWTGDQITKHVTYSIDEYERKTCS